MNIKNSFLILFLKKTTQTKKQFLSSKNKQKPKNKQFLSSLCWFFICSDSVTNIKAAPILQFQL